MALALIVINFLASVALATATIAGMASAYGWMEVHLRTHVLLAMFAAFLVLFGHSMTMFYFIGTGVRLKELVAEHAVHEEDLIRPTVRFKMRVFPITMLAILATIVTFILGGGVDTGSLPGWVHLILALAALTLQFLAIQKETWAIHANVRLFDRLDEILSAREGGPR